MFKRCLVAENRKLHASPIWIVFFVLPVISAIYGTYNYLQNLGILTDQWYSLWTQHTLFYALFFFPVLVGVYAAYLWRLEHMGHNWNLIMAAPVRPLCLFLAKYVIVLKLVLLTQMLVFALYFFCGKAFAHLPGLPPLETFLYLLRGLAGGQCVIALQLILSMLIRSFAGVHRSGRRRGRHADGQQGYRAGISLRADAGRHELQQERGYSGGQLWRLHSGLAGVAAAFCRARPAAADPAGCAFLIRRGIA